MTILPAPKPLYQQRLDKVAGSILFTPGKADHQLTYMATFDTVKPFIGIHPTEHQ
jgi:hypothetical protein